MTNEQTNTAIGIFNEAAGVEGDSDHATKLVFDVGFGKWRVEVGGPFGAAATGETPARAFQELRNKMQGPAVARIELLKTLNDVIAE